MDQNFPFYELESGCTAQHSGALAALRLLRSYNHFLVPPDIHGVVGPLLGNMPQPCLPPPASFCHHLPVRTSPFTSPLSPTHHPPPTESEIRRRGEKRPIPPELKDDKYFERRRRNNQAAKKSRDARRVREDQIAWRACVLEQENAALRAHIAALRREAIALRAMLARDDPVPSSTTPD